MVLGAGIPMRVPLTPMSTRGVWGADAPSWRPYRSLAAAPPRLRSTGPSSKPARALGWGAGVLRERKLGEGTTGWTGSGKGWRPLPTPAEAPRDGGGAGASLALPFLSVCLEPQRLPTSRPPKGLTVGRGSPLGGAASKREV